ncbi:MAG: sodium:solute symporter family protein, partial [Saprospiraceae bacterium]|nr:sodium:solute symporter family protein [Saprospiraceae bacterium]
MLKTLLIAGTLYLAVLVFMSWSNRSTKENSKDFFLAGSNLGSFLGLFTFAATLFSTFTILGMPDFFRVHGVGAWIFIAVSDLVMVFGVLWFGYLLRTKVDKETFMGMAGFMSKRYDAAWVGYIVFGTAFIFLIPYVAIQIRGVAIFLDQAFPNSVPLAVWAIGMVVVMILYSEIGGLKAIIYNDVVQGILLMIVIWIIGWSCLKDLGGLGQMFEQVAEKEEALLSVPGPKGLFDFQFLFGSMVAICMIPFTQPQVSCRLVIMKDHRSLGRTALGLGGFAILVIAPTMFIGMYGAFHYGDASTSDFLGQTLLRDQSGTIGALVLIGLIAAAISTADSQLFALGGETRSMLRGEDRRMMRYAKICIVIFALLSLAFALMSSDELVLLARASFAGTALLGPLVFFGLFNANPAKHRLLP